MNHLMKILKDLNSPHRFKNIDVLRGFAIIATVVLHFDLKKFHYGSLGVDLFFVISGFLVSGTLIQSFMSGKRINVLSFFSRRALRILPSYLIFILLGKIISDLLYTNTYPELIVQIKELPRFLFFYYNYSPLPNFIFNHVWSISVEEHFYLMLPIGFLIVQKKFPQHLEKLFILSIFSVLALKTALFLYNGYFAYAVTHGRLDALMLGVLIRYFYEKNILKKIYGKKYVFLFGLVLLATTVFFDATLLHESFFCKVCTHFLVPISFCIIIVGTFGWSMRFFTPIRIVSYFSYNWYLWHLMLSYWIFDKIGKGTLGFFIYALSGLFLGVLGNQLIENPIINLKLKLQKNIKH